MSVHFTQAGSVVPDWARRTVRLLLLMKTLLRVCAAMLASR